MKLYCVFGDEYHVGRTLLGIYDSLELAEKRKSEIDRYGYDRISIDEIELNQDIE